MNMDLAVDQLIAPFKLDTNQQVAVGKAKEILKKILNDLFKLQDNPPRLTFDKMLALFVGELERQLSSSPTIKTIEEIARRCIFAAQIVAMRGDIVYKNAFNSQPYYAIYTGYASLAIFIARYSRFGIYANFNTEAKNAFLATSDPLIIMHGAIAYGDKLEDFLRTAFIDKPNYYGEKAVELALRLGNTRALNTLHLSLNPNIPDQLAKKMVQMIEDSGLILTARLSYPDEDKKKFQTQLSLLIKSFIEYDVVTIGDLNMARWSDLGPHSSENGLGLLNGCAGSEIEEPLEIFATILHKLQDESSRIKFFSIDAVICPSVLCALSFSLAPMLGGQSRDVPYNLVSFADLLNQIFTPYVHHKKLSYWEMRILVLFNLLPPKTIDDRNGIEELLECAKTGENDRLLFLLNLGVNPNGIEYSTNKNSLHLAAQHGNIVGVIYLLADSRTQILALTKKDKTAYTLAIESGHPSWENQKELLNKLNPAMFQSAPPTTSVVTHAKNSRSASPENIQKNTGKIVHTVKNNSI